MTKDGGYSQGAGATSHPNEQHAMEQFLYQYKETFPPLPLYNLTICPMIKHPLVKVSILYAV